MALIYQCAVSSGGTIFNLIACEVLDKEVITTVAVGHPAPLFY